MKKKIKKILVTVGIILAIIVVIVIGLKIKDNTRANRIVKSHITTENTVTNTTSDLLVSTAVQQIMIGGLCNNYDNALQTLKAIKNAGYDAIELNDFMIQKTAPIIKLMTKFAGMPVGNGALWTGINLLKKAD